MMSQYPPGGPSPESTDRVGEAVQAGLLKRFWPLLLVLMGISLVWATGLHRYLSPDSLVEHRAALKSFVSTNFWLSLLVFMGVYVLAVALSVPGAIVLTLLAGLLFGVFVGSVAVVLAATAGATLVFLIARSALRENLKRRAGPSLTRILDGFKADAVSYLLFLRLVPLFPFWLVNLAPAFAGVPLKLFVLTTLAGIIPGSVAFVAAGAGADSVLAAHATTLELCRATANSNCQVSLQLSSLVTPQIGIALALLGLVSLIPVVWRRYAAKPSA